MLNTQLALYNTKKVEGAASLQNTLSLFPPKDKGNNSNVIQKGFPGGSEMGPPECKPVLLNFRIYCFFCSVVCIHDMQFAALWITARVATKFLS
jgi:hypothetical protein